MNEDRPTMPFEIEARLRTTLTQRAEDMAPGDGRPWTLGGPGPRRDPALRLVPREDGMRRRIPHRALAAVAVATAVVGVSAGVALSRDGTDPLEAGNRPTQPADPTTTVPCDPTAPTTTVPAEPGVPGGPGGPTTVPGPTTTEVIVPSTAPTTTENLPPSTTTPRPSTTEMTVPSTTMPPPPTTEAAAATGRDALPTLAGTPLQTAEDCLPTTTVPPAPAPLHPTSQGLYISDVDPGVYLYLTWYPSSQMIEGIPQGEPITAGTNHGFYEASAYPEGNYDSVWLAWEDGLLGIHGSLVRREDLLAVAASVSRAPGAAQFSSTPPPGFSAGQHETSLPAPSSD